MKKLLLILVLASLALAALAVFTEDMEYLGYTGVLEERGGHWWLHESYGDSLRLLLAPQAKLDSLEYVMAAGDTVSVEGFREKELFLVGKMWNLSREASMLWLRWLDYGNLSANSLSSYNVDATKCIGCRLCVAPCPMGAITMVKGKAVIDLEKCVECGICIEGYGKFKGCPVRAIAPK